MGVPDIRDYHIAAILDQRKFWFNSPEQKQWREAEQAQAEQGHIKDLLLSTTIADPTHYKQHPTIAATLRAWKYFVRNRNIHVKHKKVPIPITALSFLTPDLK